MDLVAQARIHAQAIVLAESTMRAHLRAFGVKAEARFLIAESKWPFGPCTTYNVDDGERGCVVFIRTGGE